MAVEVLQPAITTSYEDGSKVTAYDVSPNLGYNYTCEVIPAFTHNHERCASQATLKLEKAFTGMPSALFLCQTHFEEASARHAKYLLSLKPVAELKQVGKALSSGKYLPYEEIPRSLNDAVARRLQGGQDKGYPALNWRQGLNDPVWLRERWRHFRNHVMDVEEGIVTEDGLQGNGDAMAWFVMVFVEAVKLHPEAVAEALRYTEKGGSIK